MIYEDVFQVIAFFLLLLIFSSLVINGIYITTRGEQEKLPNGKWQDINDMIFYPAYKFLMQEREPPRRIYYSGEELVFLYRDIMKQRPLPAAHEIMFDYLWFDKDRNTRMVINKEGEEPAIFVSHAVSLWQEFAKELLDPKDIIGEYATDRVRFYKEYKRYRFSKYLRKPILQCIRCMASFWGSLIFWPVVVLMLGYDNWEIPTWICFCFALSYVNTYLYDKIS